MSIVLSETPKTDFVASRPLHIMCPKVKIRSILDGYLISLKYINMRDKFPYLEDNEMMDAMDSVHRYYAFFRLSVSNNDISCDM